MFNTYTIAHVKILIKEFRECSNNMGGILATANHPSFVCLKIGEYPKNGHVNVYNDARNPVVLIPSCASCYNKAQTMNPPKKCQKINGFGLKGRYSCRQFVPFHQFNPMFTPFPSMKSPFSMQPSHETIIFLWFSYGFLWFSYMVDQSPFPLP